MDINNVFLNLPDNLVILSPEYKILAMNEAYLQATMRSREELVGKSFLLEAFPDESVPYEQNPVKLSLDRAAASKKVDYFPASRYDIPKPDGTFDVRYWEASHTPVFDEQGALQYIIQKTSDVTDRERAKLEAIASENKFRFMAETLPQLIFTVSPQGKLTYLNQRWATYTGISTETLINEGWNNILEAEELEKISRKWREGFEKGQDIQLEVRKRSKDGQYRWFLCKSQPMRDEQGNIVMWAGSCTDIHDMRQMVQELLQSNEQMSALSDQVQFAYKKAETERKTLENLIMKAPAFFCLLDGPEHRFKLVNDKYQQLFPNRQLEGRTVAEAVPEVIEQGFIAILDNVYTTGKEFVAEEIAVKLDLHDTGNIDDVYLNFIYQALYDDTDKITGILVFGYVVDEQVKYRQKLEELGKA
ncbi:PAS domain-containing protein [Adhaeribacter sp. BT258]|uniref:histidine kinase n=1 Tax=Adhaeribacter terrigena TaxID=2793070 RepID=A0ABS1C1W6_9BACT|nr:PAS domain-containing protein [Adhaeribacter terrigena]MBK0403393.1 PAS domain-containing protein [Adhaeribacter terrigena]